MNKFKVGNIVTGIRGHLEDYTYTTSEAKMRVIGVYKEGRKLEVEIIKHTRYPGQKGSTFRVDSEDFKLITLENK